MKTLKVLTVSILSLLGVVALVPTGLATISSLIPMVTLALNTNPPAYIKDIVVYKEGEDLVIYLTMADDRGALTRAEGMLTVSLQQDGLPVWTTTHAVSRSDFQTTTVGLGSFERTTLLYSLGRISERSLSHAQRGKLLTIQVLFITMDMAELKGTQTYWF
jgi:hypothetical protein